LRQPSFSDATETWCRPALIGADRAPASLVETRASLAFLQSEYPDLMERWREHKRTLGTGR
jgi:hypothetical protein